MNVSEGMAWEEEDDARRAPHDSTGENQTRSHFKSRFYALFLYLYPFFFFEKN